MKRTERRTLSKKALTFSNPFPKSFIINVISFKLTNISLTLKRGAFYLFQTFKMVESTGGMKKDNPFQGKTVDNKIYTQIIN